MSLKRMKGVVDPITLGFIIAVLGTATVLTFDKAEADVETAAQPVEIVEPLVASQQ